MTFNKPPFVELMHMTPAARELVAFKRARHLPASLAVPSREKLERFAAWVVVACEGELHVVVVSERGRVGLLHHAPRECRRWRDFRELGGGAGCPECVKWLLSLAARSPPGGPSGLVGQPRQPVVPPDFARLMDRASMKRINRNMKRQRIGDADEESDP